MDWLSGGITAAMRAVLGAIGLPKLVEWLKESRRSGKEAEIHRLAYEILETIKPSHERGNLFTVDHIAQSMGKTPDQTFAALLFLRDKGLAYRQPDGWWQLGHSEDPAKAIWGSH